MPPAKKTSSSARRPAARRATPSSAATRRQVERATAKFEKSLEEAGVALSSIGKDIEKGSQAAYRDMAKALKALQSNAKKTNKQVLKDLEKLAAAVTPTKTAARKPATASRSSTARKTTAASKSSSASKPAASKPAARKAPARRTATRSK